MPASEPLSAQAAPAPAQPPSLTVDRDPVRSPDGEPPLPPSLRKEGEDYILHADVDEVVLNCSVLNGKQLVPDLKRENFQVFEDGVRQRLISFQHTDLPVSIALVVDNSGSMPRGQQKHSRPDPGLQSPGRGLRGQLLRRGLSRPGFHL